MLEALESLKIHVAGTAPLARVEGEHKDGSMQVRRDVLWREHRELFAPPPDEAARLVAERRAKRVTLTGPLADLARAVLPCATACEAAIAAMQAGFRVWHAVPAQGTWRPAPGGGPNGPLAVGFRDEADARAHWAIFPDSLPLFVLRDPATQAERAFVRGEAGGLVPIPSHIVSMKG